MMWFVILVIIGISYAVHRLLVEKIYRIDYFNEDRKARQFVMISAANEREAIQTWINIKRPWWRITDYEEVDG